jgi:hypothetical protein
VKAKVMPIIGGTTEIMSKPFGRYLRNIPGKNEVKALQKTFNMGHNIARATNCNYRIAATL